MYQESDSQRERRLLHEARTVRLGTFSHDWLTPKMDVTSVRVEVTLGSPFDGDERCGFYLVNVPSMEPTGDEERDLRNHPASLAVEVIHERVPDAQIDEVLPA
jgi:hypothetical protein